MDPADIATIAAAVLAALAIWFAYPGWAQARSERSIARFRTERRALLATRPDLVLRAALQFPSSMRIPGTPCLTSRHWILPAPIPLDSVRVRFSPDRRTGVLNGASPAAKRLLPHWARKISGATYSGVLASDPSLRPKLFWDGISYDLRDFRVEPDGVAVDLGLANFFEMVDVCESFAHEFSVGRASQRRAMARLCRDPLDLSVRVNIPALTWILLIREPLGPATFVLHARDVAAVVSDGQFRHAFGGQVQPSSAHTLSPESETALWKSFAREFAEEVLGHEGSDGHAGAPLDFTVPPLSTLREMTDDGRLAVYLLGLVVDPLSRWPSMLGVAICARESLGALPPFVNANQEGIVIGSKAGPDGAVGYPLTREMVNRLCADPLVGMSAKGCLVRIWEHRERLGLLPHHPEGGAT